MSTPFLYGSVGSLCWGNGCEGEAVRCSQAPVKNEKEEGKKKKKKAKRETETEQRREQAGGKGEERRGG